VDELIPEEPLTTRDAIINGAWLCFQEKGPDKTTIAAIARKAGVSRDTVYRYFTDSEAIFRATAEQVSQAFYALLAEELATASTIDEQLARVGMFLCRSKQWVPMWGEAYDAERVALLTTVYSRVLLADFTAFLGPYLEIARVRNEIRSDIDIDAAAEWLARVLMSLFTTPSPSIDLDDPETVYTFVTDFAVRGLSAPLRPTNHVTVSASPPATRTLDEKASAQL
jgi:AcrR family transcriptional regulator